MSTTARGLGGLPNLPFEGLRIPVDHFLILVLYALLISVFFALLWRSERRERVGLFVKLFLALVVGALAVAWLMYPFPS